MSNLIPLLTIFIYSCCYASGHHRGEQDIELSPVIMEFLCTIKEEPLGPADPYDDLYLDKSTEIFIPFRRLSHSIDYFIEKYNETKHYNSPVITPKTSKEEQ